MRTKTDVDYDGRLASSYESGRDITPAAEATWRTAVEDHIREPGLVVDVGAGTGRFARRLAKHFDLSVTAVEPAHGMRTNAAITSAQNDIAWIGGTAEALPLRSGCADVLWSAFATHYYDLAGAAHEFARVVTPDGRVLAGLANLCRHGAIVVPEPVYASNVLLVFKPVRAMRTETTRT